MSTRTPPPAEVFLSEAEELLAEAEAALLDLEDNPADTDQINRAFRALHTIKGSGAMFGFAKVAEFTHHVESAFQKVRDGEQALNAALLGLTLEALDHIRDLLDGVENADRAGRILDALATVFGARADSAPPPGGAPQAPETAGQTAGPGRWRIRLRLGPQTLALGTNPLRLLDELRELGPCVVVALPDGVPGLEDLDPVVCYLEWDILLTTEQPRSALDDVFLFVADDGEITITPVADGDEAPRLGEILVQRGDVSPDALSATLEQQRPLGRLLVEAGAVSPERVVSALVEQHQTRGRVEAAAAAATATATVQNATAEGHGSVRVQAERLDSLMDLVGELVIAQARLRQVAARSPDVNLRAISEEIERLSSDLRDTTMGIRMVPIGTLFGRFRRVVRDLSQNLGKAVDLTTAGEESELDKTVIERLNDPLVHLIRNAIDHGLETADQRRAAGKPERGHIHLSAVHCGAQVLISVADDGRGIDRARVRAKAEERGLLAPDVQIPDAELLAFIFHPGFSTAAQVSAVSGRGVGMDVVKRTIDTLRGSIDVASTPGEGAVITLKLPLTLAIIDGLLVRVGDGRYVIPLSAVEECVELTPDVDTGAQGCAFLNIRGSLVPFLRLRDLFHATGAPDAFPKVVVVSTGTMRVGLVVDQVIGQHQTVIKSMTRLLADVREFSGATILGDGSVALIMDVQRLVELGQQDRTSLSARSLP